MSAIISLYKQALTNWSPSGRSSRSEFWAFIGVHLVVCVVLIASALILAQASEPRLGQPVEGTNAIIINVSIFLLMLTLLIYVLIMFWPTMALCIRRWHDFGIGAGLIILYPLGFLLAAVVPPNEGANRYGEQPGTASQSLSEEE